MFLGSRAKKTSISESIDFLSSIGRKIARGKDGNLNYYTTVLRFKEDLIISIILWEKGGLLDSINVDIGATNDQIFVDDLMAFTPKNIMEEYGSPAKTSFFLSYPTEQTTSNNVDYGYTLQYQRLILQYYGQRVPAQSLVYACPMLDTGLRGLKLWLGEKPKHPPPDGVDLEIATSLTLDDFYQLMIGNPDEACIELNAAAF